MLIEFYYMIVILLYRGRYSGHKYVEQSFFMVLIKYSNLNGNCSSIW